MRWVLSVDQALFISQPNICQGSSGTTSSTQPPSNAPTLMILSVSWNTTTFHSNPLYSLGLSLGTNDKNKHNQQWLEGNGNLFLSHEEIWAGRWGLICCFNFRASQFISLTGVTANFIIPDGSPPVLLEASGGRDKEEGYKVHWCCLLRKVPEALTEPFHFHPLARTQSHGYTYLQRMLGDVLYSGWAFCSPKHSNFKEKGESG